MSYIFLAISLISGLAFLYKKYFSKEASFLKQLKKAPLTNLNLCKEGDMIKIYGYAKMHEKILQGPITNFKCFYYQSLVQENTGNRSNNLRTVIREENSVDFILMVNEVEVLINTEQVRWYIKTGSWFQSGVLNNVKPLAKKFLERHNFSAQGLIFNKSLDFTELLIEPGRKLTVYGKAMWLDIPSETPGLPSRKTLSVQAISKDKPAYVIENLKLL